MSENLYLERFLGCRHIRDLVIEAFKKGMLLQLENGRDKFGGFIEGFYMFGDETGAPIEPDGTAQEIQDYLDAWKAGFRLRLSLLDRNEPFNYDLD